MKKWRSWRAAGKWRQSERGKKCRQAQSRRYRRLIPLPVLAEPSATATEPMAGPVPSASAPPPADPVSAETREGQRFATIPEDFLIRACRRPGCYELFGVPTKYSLKRFCCAVCRKALGRVRERESRYHQRRRAGFRPRRRGSRPSPKPRK